MKRSRKQVISSNELKSSKIKKTGNRSRDEYKTPSVIDCNYLQSSTNIQHQCLHTSLQRDKLISCKEKLNFPRYFELVPKQLVAIILDQQHKAVVKGNIALKVIQGNVSIYGFTLTQQHNFISVSSLTNAAFISIDVSTWDKSLSVPAKNESSSRCRVDRQDLKKQLRTSLRHELSRVSGRCVTPASAQSIRVMLNQIEPGQVVLLARPLQDKAINYCTHFYPKLLPDADMGIKGLTNDYGFLINDVNDDDEEEDKDDMLNFNLSYQEAVSHIEDYNGQAVIVCCGGKNMGKSTFNRYLINRLLSSNSFSQVMYLEADPGQTEFTPPACISLHLITQPVIGSPLSHMSKLCRSGNSELTSNMDTERGGDKGTGVGEVVAEGSSIGEDVGGGTSVGEGRGVGVGRGVGEGTGEGAGVDEGRGVGEGAGVDEGIGVGVGEGRDVGNSRGVECMSMCYLGVINVEQNTERYVKCVAHTYSQYRQYMQRQSVQCVRQSQTPTPPLIVNTMGWNSGVGLVLLRQLLHTVRPSHVVEMHSNVVSARNMPPLDPCSLRCSQLYHEEMMVPATASTTTDAQDDTQTTPLAYQVLTVESPISSTQSCGGLSPQERRELATLSYLSTLQPLSHHVAPLDLLPSHSSHTYWLQWTHLALAVCNVPPATLSYQHLLYTFNGSLVALATATEEQMSQSVRGADESLPRFFPRSAPVCECVGFGIVVSIDMSKKRFCIMTPVGAELLESINTLLQGDLHLPHRLLLTQSQVPLVPYTYQRSNIKPRSVGSTPIIGRVYQPPKLSK